MGTKKIVTGFTTHNFICWNFDKISLRGCCMVEATPDALSFVLHNRPLSNKEKPKHVYFIIIIQTINFGFVGNDIGLLFLHIYYATVGIKYFIRNKF
jgi:hypothetical protein